jgi:hypothetical protein
VVRTWKRPEKRLGQGLGQRLAIGPQIGHDLGDQRLDAAQRLDLVRGEPGQARQLGAGGDMLAVVG